MKVLNEDIHEFDYIEEEQQDKLHSLWEWIKRIPFMIDAGLFYRTYKDECKYLIEENQRLKKGVKFYEEKEKN